MAKHTIKCPTCGRVTELSDGLFGSRGLPASYTCPMCGTLIDVAKAAAMSEERRKGLISVIEYKGDNTSLVWRHPLEDFNLGSQLVVRESQEAIFLRDGQALDTFGAGRHTLETNNLPLFQRFYALPTNAETPFHCEVYFIDLTTHMGNKWGTDSKVRFFDTATGMPVEIGACGQFDLRVSDSRKLLLKLVGTAESLSQSDIADTQLEVTATGSSVAIKTIMPKFKAMIMTKVKSSLARIIKDNGINILEVDEHLETISAELRDTINDDLAAYGLVMPGFFVTTIMTPDDDPNFRRLKQQHADMYLKIREEQIRKAEAEAAAERQTVEATTAAKMKVIGAQGDAEAHKLKAAAEAAEMQMKGYTYQQETARQVGLAAMNNQGGASGGLGDLAGLGVSLGAMGSVIGMTREAMTPISANVQGIGQAVTETIAPTAAPAQDGWECSCGQKNIQTKFCPECGSKKPEQKPADTWTCTECGTVDIKTKFCPNCGTKRPEPPAAWICTECGTSDITTKFCPNCGAKKPEPPAEWICPDCGQQGIKTRFCPNCGRKKGNE